MAKRCYSPSIEFNDENGIIIIEYNGKKYSWPISEQEKQVLLGDIRFDYDIIYNADGNAFINVEDLRTNKYVMRQQINLIK